MERIVTEVAVIGAGPGGYPAAFALADKGKKVTLIDPEANPGGVCLYRGCIPSKALLHAARVAEEARDAVDFGLSYGEPKVDPAEAFLVERRGGGEAYGRAQVACEGKKDKLRAGKGVFYLLGGPLCRNKFGGGAGSRVSKRRYRNGFCFKENPGGGFRFPKRGRF